MKTAAGRALTPWPFQSQAAHSARQAAIATAKAKRLEKKCAEAAAAQGDGEGEGEEEKDEEVPIKVALTLLRKAVPTKLDGSNSGHCLSLIFHCLSLPFTAKLPPMRCHPMPSNPQVALEGCGASIITPHFPSGPLALLAPEGLERVELWLGAPTRQMKGARGARGITARQRAGVSQNCRGTESDILPAGAQVTVLHAKRLRRPTRPR